MDGSHVVIVGGGISGLSAAWELSRTVPEAAITVVDAADRPGGKLRREPVAGVPIDVGAESMLARRPEAVALVDELGAAAELVHPVTTAAGIWSRGELHPMPAGTLMGIPSRPSSALGILTPDEVDRAEHETDVPGSEVGEDISLGDYVARRLGNGVVDRLVEPLLGGVYAGRARALSLRACLPAAFDTARQGGSLTATASSAADASAGSSGPVFAGLVGGVGRVAELLVEQLRSRGVVFRSSTIARELHRTGDGWALVVGPRPAPERVTGDAVVLAAPGSPSGRLLAPHAPGAARALSAIEYASMAIVTLAVDASGADRLPGSGFLVPPVEGRTIKGSTFTSAKWAWAATAGEGLAFLRASVGRAGETSDLHRRDEELIAIAVAEVSEAVGHQLPRIIDAHVQRWGGAMPQYTVGHVGRVAQVREGVAALPGLEVAGAAYEGVGIPACIASGRAAAAAVATHLRARRPGGGE